MIKIQNPKSKIQIPHLKGKGFWFFVVALAFGSLTFGLSFAHAQIYTLTNPLKYGTLIELIQAIINGLIQLSIPLAAGLVVWAGILYMFAAASPQQLQKATKALTYTVLGFAILLISSGIISIIQSVLGVKQACDYVAYPATGCAQGYTCDLVANTCGFTGGGPSTLDALIKIFSDLSGWLFAFAIIVGLAMIIISGIAYIFARGNEEQAKKATKMLLYSVVGVAVAALAWSIINIVSNFLTGQPAFSMLMLEAKAVAAPNNVPMGGPQNLTGIFKLVQDSVGWLFVFGVIGGVGAIIIAGIMFMTAAGNPRRVETASKMLVYAILGVAVVGLAWGIVNLIGNYFVSTRLIK